MPVHPADLDTDRLDRERLASALEGAMRKRDHTQYDVAETVGVSQAFIAQILGRKNQPGRKTLARILDAYGIAPADVMRKSTRASKANKAPVPLQQEILQDDVVMIPRNGYAAAGHGAQNDDGAALDPYNTTNADPYPRHELYRLTGINPDLFRSATVVGDSHLPEITPNSRVIYFPTDRIAGDGLHVLSIDGDEIVKRVQRLPGGVLHLVSTNPAYQTVVLTPLPDADTPNTYRVEDTGTTATIRVVGKVVFYAKPA